MAVRQLFDTSPHRTASSREILGAPRRFRGAPAHLFGMNSQTSYRNEFESILSLSELAARLGVTAQTIYDLRSQGRGPHGFRIGRQDDRRLRASRPLGHPHPRRPARGGGAGRGIQQRLLPGAGGDPATGRVARLRARARPRRRRTRPRQLPAAGGQPAARRRHPSHPVDRPQHRRTAARDEPARPGPRRRPAAAPDRADERRHARRPYRTATTHRTGHPAAHHRRSGERRRMDKTARKSRPRPGAASGMGSASPPPSACTGKDTTSPGRARSEARTK
jgi:predicted DNA-binding transcriptional regulator AlpA